MLLPIYYSLSPVRVLWYEQLLNYFFNGIYKMFDFTGIKYSFDLILDYHYIYFNKWILPTK